MEEAVLVGLLVDHCLGKLLSRLDSLGLVGELNLLQEIRYLVEVNLLARQLEPVFLEVQEVVPAHRNLEDYLALQINRLLQLSHQVPQKLQDFSEIMRQLHLLEAMAFLVKNQMLLQRAQDYSDQMVEPHRHKVIPEVNHLEDYLDNPRNLIKPNLLQEDYSEEEVAMLNPLQEDYSEEEVEMLNLQQGDYLEVRRHPQLKLQLEAYLVAVNQLKQNQHQIH